jgi:SAM-dependent methyltransferase
MSGICYSWVTGESILAMDRTNDIAYQWQDEYFQLRKIKHYITDQNWELFADCNKRLSTMYDSWIDYTLSVLSFTSDYSVIDTAANAGYFLYRFKEKGAGKCIGYDKSDFSDVYSTLNQITGHNVEFYNKPYDMVTHKISDALSADIVISSAIMCHLSDPLNYLSFLGSITKKALLFFSTVDQTDTYQITFDGVKHYYPDVPFPNCFDVNTRISKGLLMFGLKELGFKEILEIPYSNAWIPFENYKNYKTIIAIK